MTEPNRTPAGVDPNTHLDELYLDEFFGDVICRPLRERGITTVGQLQPYSRGWLEQTAGLSRGQAGVVIEKMAAIGHPMK